MVALGLPFVGIVYLVIGAWVWRMRPDRAATWALFLFCCVMAAELALPPVPGRIAWSMVWMNIPLIGATTFHLFTTYPTEPAWVVRSPWMRWVPYALAFALGLLASMEGMVGIEVPFARAIGFWFTIAMSILSLGVAAIERRRQRESKAAGRADVMLLGAAISFVPALTAVISRTLLGTDFPWVLGFFSFFVFPLAVAYGIVRRQLFEIRMVAKSSATYGAATLAITGIYAFLITFADAAVSRFNMNARSPLFSVGLPVLRDPRLQSAARPHAGARRPPLRPRSLALSARGARDLRGDGLDALHQGGGGPHPRRAHRDDGRRARDGDAAGRGRAAARFGGVARRVGRRGARDPDRPRAPDLPAPALAPRRAGARRLRRRAGSRSCARRVATSSTSSRSSCWCRSCSAPSCSAWWRWGASSRARRLSADDVQLLRTLANQSSIAIENAKAFDEIADLNATLEARVDERTRELHQAQAQLVHGEKMRSLGQLVAGVAHELNNPIGFVHANLQLLTEYVPKLAVALRTGQDTTKIESAIEKLLARSREGTERVKQIVADLRTFSRMEQATLAEVDLNREIDRAITLMEPRLKDGIDVERDYGQLPPVRCYAGQLNQVFTNLLMNACDALDGKGRIRIRTRARQGGLGQPDGVRLEFHDDGPGISPEVQARIFEPFFTTKPVGQGTGLGLSISYGIVERHGGRMLVGSAPGAGTTFVVELPLVAKLPAEEDAT